MSILEHKMLNSTEKAYKICVTNKMLETRDSDVHTELQNVGMNRKGVENCVTNKILCYNQNT